MIGEFKPVPLEDKYNICLECPQMELTVETSKLYSNGEVYYTRNSIYCIHRYACKALRERAVNGS